MYEKSGSGIPVGLSHENIQRIWITSFLSAFYVFPLLKSPTGGRRMIRKMKLTDLDKVMDIWLFLIYRLMILSRGILAEQLAAGAFHASGGGSICV